MLPLALLLALALPQDTTSATPDSGAAHWGQEYFPNVPLVAHDGRTLRFFDDLVKDKVVVINFIYTSCADACPLETARLVEIQEILGERVGKDVFFYSLSIDPERDTPEVLAEYAERFQVKPGWLFLTGKEADITSVRKKLGLYVDLVQADGSKNHNLSVILGNQATGRWMRTSPMENPYVVAAKVGDWLHNWKDPREAGHDYEEAPELRQISRGESLFRTRCSSCHAIGPGDGKTRTGPNLLGVSERRERDWLERWITAPDEMLAAGDPIATSLFEAFGRVQMPNLSLNALEVESLLEYVETEGRRAAHAELVVDELPARDVDGAPAACCQKNEALVLGAEPIEEAAAGPTPAPEADSTCCADGEHAADSETDGFAARGPSLDEPDEECCLDSEEDVTPPSPVTRVLGDIAQESSTLSAEPEAALESPEPSAAIAPASRAPGLSLASKLSIAAGLLLGALTLLHQRLLRNG
jgi:protein SCO1/2